MAGDRPGENSVFLLRAASDIVDQQRALALLAVRDNPAMGQLAADDAGDDIAGQIGLRFLRKGLLRPVAFEECPHVRNAAVIDIAIRFTESPDLGIGGKGLFHIQMDQLLQVKVQPVAIGPDDHIGACSRFPWKIAIGIVDAVIGLAVNGGYSNLTACGLDKARGAGSALGEQKGGSEEGDACDSHEIAASMLHWWSLEEGGCILNERRILKSLKQAGRNHDD